MVCRAGPRGRNGANDAAATRVEETKRWKGVFGDGDDDKGSDGEKDSDATEHKRNGVDGPGHGQGKGKQEKMVETSDGEE